jgi:hypothetical protein
MEIYEGPPNEWSFKVEGITSEKRRADYLIWIVELDEMVILAWHTWQNNLTVAQF